MGDLIFPLLYITVYEKQNKDPSNVLQNTQPVKKINVFSKVIKSQWCTQSISLSLDSPDHFDIVTFGMDSGLFHRITVQDGGNADG